VAQKVYESVTQEGRWGLFTDGTLVVGLGPNDNAQDQAKKLGFTWVAPPDRGKPSWKCPMCEWQAPPKSGPYAVTNHQGYHSLAGDKP
jgi:hypothetical protein